MPTDSSGDEYPPWLKVLDADDLQFLLKFLVTSGSLKDLATEYAVSYPTIRQRLDRLIAKVVAANDTRAESEFHRKLRVLVADGRLPANLAKELLTAHRKSLSQE